MNRLPQDAADSLAGYEQQQKWRQRVLADRDRLTANPVVGTWTGALSQADKEYVAREVAAGNIEF